MIQMSTTWFRAIWLVSEDPRASCRLGQTRGLGTRLVCLLTLVGIWHERWTYGPRSSRCERLVLEERPHRTPCGRSRTQRLRGTTVPVQDRTGMEICNANCACATLWIVPLTSEPFSPVCISYGSLNHNFGIFYGAVNFKSSFLLTPLIYVYLSNN